MWVASRGGRVAATGEAATLEERAVAGLAVLAGWVAGWRVVAAGKGVASARVTADEAD